MEEERCVAAMLSLKRPWEAMSASGRLLATMPNRERNHEKRGQEKLSVRAQPTEARGPMARQELSKAQQRVQELQGEVEAASNEREMMAKENAEVEHKLAVANEDIARLARQYYV